jgi:hypothetical protein
VNKPVVVATGTWSGQPWKLVAFNSRGTGTCWGITYDNPPPAQDVIAQLSGPGVVSGSANGLGCGSIVGIRLPHIHENFTTITWMIARSQSNAVPAWIAGPVIESVKKVTIDFDNGSSVDAPTYAPPESLGRLRWFQPIRFYAAQLPPTASGAAGDPFPHKLIGFDANGKIVACSLGFGYSPPSACKQ